MPKTRRKETRTRGPLTAAGLISFYEELEEGLRVSPATVLIAAMLFALIVVIIGKLFPPA